MSVHVDWEQLYRYGRGVCAADERERVEQWRAEYPARRRLVEAFGDVLDHAELLTQRFDVDAACARLRSELGTTRKAESGMVIRRPCVTLRMAPSTSHTRIGPRMIAVAVLVIVMISTLVWSRPFFRRGVMSHVASLKEIVAARGQLVEIRLEDGTHVVLAAESRLRYAAAFGKRTRDVYLDGQAYFDVAHDTDWPFVVHAEGVMAEDLGTTFAVRAYPDDPHVQVVVASGRVALRAASPGAPERVLVRNELGQINKDEQSIEIKHVDASAYVAWTSGRLVFDQTALLDVLAQLHRWYDVDFKLADSALAARHFTGAFGGESIAQIIEAIGPPLHVRFERSGNTYIVSPLPDSK